MSKPYKTCEYCGAHLDSGEKCDCKEARKVNPRWPVRKRYETCRECGKKWNVSKLAVVPMNGYLCPRCRVK